MSTPKTRILVVDDSDDLASILVMVIDNEPDMMCVGRLSAADTLLETVAQKRPDVVLLDYSMPGCDALEVMEEALAGCTETRFIVHSGYNEPERVKEALDRGARSFVTKDGDIAKILNAIRGVTRGKDCPAPLKCPQ